MRNYRKWVMTLGLVAATPQVTLAGGFGLPWSNTNNTSTAANAEAQVQAQQQQVAEAVASALRNRVTGEVNIEFANGVATLKGRVPDQATKTTAQQLTQSVPGVQRVNNLLVAAQPTAAGAIQQVSAEFPAPPHAVQSAAFETRSGQPSGLQQVAAARDAQQRSATPAPAQAPPRFAAVAPPTPPAPGPSPQQVANNVAQAMASNGLGNVEARVQNGECTLQGNVMSAQQANLATQVARTVPGINSVQNNLRVEGPQPGIAPANFQAGGAEAPPSPGAGYPPGYGPMGYPPGYGPSGYPPAGVTPPPPGWGQPGASAAPVGPVYEQPNVPQYAWPTTAAAPNYAALSYPQQYSASAWPYIGPFYPYPQVPLGWRKVTLEWDDGQWFLDFNDRTDRWWWFLNPKKW